MGIENFFSCGKSGNKVRDFPNVRVKENGCSLAQASIPSLNAPKRNHSYALCSKDEQEEFHDVVTDMLQVFFIDVYDLIHPGSTLSFVTPLVSRKFDVLPCVD